MQNFDNLGIEELLLRGIKECNYKNPTTIQKKAIPIALRGRDVVVMARTGSGKTASFLIPLFQKLKKHSDEGIRALIILPTKDLALQTVKFVQNIGYYLDLTFALIIGGESIEDQFLAIHQNPDILIGTPGRLLHMLSEMSLKLPKVEFVVFDEADRLYEMGFMEDLRAILKITASNRQTMLISATLPKSLLKFSMLGLQNPEFIRLDLDFKISDKLKLRNFYCKKEDKICLLIYLLKEVIPKKEKTLVFVPTHYHAEWVKEVLEGAQIKCSVAYSKMDDEYRRINCSKFYDSVTHIMIATDIASRGIDIPTLDNVINFSFPFTERIFIHRVGRAARAGRDGTAYSFVSLDELPYILEFFAFLGKNLTVCSNDCSNESTSFDNILGAVPQQIFDDINDFIKLNGKEFFDKSYSAMNNSEKKLKSLSKKPNPEYVATSKTIDISSITIHPIFREKFKTEQFSISHLRFVNCKPIGTVLEKVAKARSNMGVKVGKKRKNEASGEKKHINLSEYATSNTNDKFKDNFSIPYRPSDDNTERGYDLDIKKPSNYAFDMVQDDPDSQMKLNTGKNSGKKWDKKRKKFVRDDAYEDARSNKVKTESGVVIKSSYATNHYKKWAKTTGINDALGEKDPKKLNKIVNQIKQKKFTPQENKKCGKKIKSKKKAKSPKNKKPRRRSRK